MFQGEMGKAKAVCYYYWIQNEGINSWRSNSLSALKYQSFH